ncbi:MAG: site-specific integrase [Bacilli bacterium]|nr:site-specific integrase [Bacilli bacterium]MDD4718867.1 site-specific integrase [Bacilli bacterium]
MITKRNKNFQIEVIKGYYYDENGIKKQIRYSETFYGKKSDARIRENEIKQAIKKGTFIDGSSLTFIDYINLFRKNYMSVELSPKTIESYEVLFVRIIEELGHYKLKDIRTIHLVEFYNRLRKINKPKKLSDNTILHYYVLINRMLVIAEKWDLIEFNPNSKIDRPKVKKKELTIYDKNTILKLFKCIDNECIKYQAIMYLAIDSGARRGELTGLSWSDIDFEKGTISINKVTQVINRKIIEKEFPKNNSSVRTINISEKTIQILKAYKEEQDKLKNKLGNKWIKSNKVFINDFGGLIHPDTPSKIFKKIREKNNLPHMKFHGLRHTSASLQIYEGVHMKVISKRLGHSSCTTTDLIYSHVDDSLDKEVANVFNNIFNEKESI